MVQSSDSIVSTPKKSTPLGKYGCAVQLRPVNHQLNSQAGKKLCFFYFLPHTSCASPWKEFKLGPKITIKCLKQTLLYHPHLLVRQFHKRLKTCIFSCCNTAHKNYLGFILTGIFLISDFHIVYICRLYALIHCITCGQVSYRVSHPFADGHQHLQHYSNYAVIPTAKLPLLEFLANFGELHQPSFHGQSQLPCWNHQSAIFKSVVSDRHIQSTETTLRKNKKSILTLNYF